MRQTARFRNYCRKTLSRQQRRRCWLLYAGLALLEMGDGVQLVVAKQSQ
jgi:hypothetical protein